MIGLLIQKASVQRQHFFPYLNENSFLRNSINGQELSKLKILCPHYEFLKSEEGREHQVYSVPIRNSSPQIPPFKFALHQTRRKAHAG